MSNGKGQSTPPSQLAAYADLFERMSDAVFLLDPQTYIVIEMNSACERWFGPEYESFKGKSLAELVKEEERDEFAKMLRVSMRRYHPRQFEMHWILGGKTLVVEHLACPLKLSDETEVLQVIARDISFKREAEQKLQELLRELKAANNRLETLSTMDEMTGLHNYRFFKGRLEAEHARSLRYNGSYAIVFCDIDHFKHFNDRNGHAAGDEVLREVANLLKKAARDTDLPARYGGEEFVVLCPETNWQQAMILAERIRKFVSESQVANAEHQPSGKLTVSVGVASFPENGKTYDQVVEAADEAMYYSKTHGRDRVTSYHTLLEIKTREKVA